MVLLRFGQDEPGDKVDHLSSSVNQQLRDHGDHGFQVVDVDIKDKNTFVDTKGDLNRRIKVTLDEALEADALVHEVAHAIYKIQIYPQINQTSDYMGRDTLNEAFAFLNSLSYAKDTEMPSYCSEGSETYRRFWDEVEEKLSGIEYRSISRGLAELEESDVGPDEMDAGEFFVQQISHLAAARMARHLDQKGEKPPEITEAPEDYIELAEDYVEDTVQRGLMEQDLDKVLYEGL